MSTLSGTIKEETAATILAKSFNDGAPISVSRAMREAGYKPSVVDSGTSAITRKEAFIAKFNEVIKDVSVITRHSELIQTDNEQVALRAVELALKVKGILSDEDKKQQSFNQFFTQINIGDDAVTE